MNFTVSVHKSSEAIPQIINGASANTIFYLINCQSLQHLECNGNTSFPSLPRDLDDFGRCALACKAFNWTDSDFEAAAVSAKQLNYNEKFIKFLQNFGRLYMDFNVYDRQDSVKQFLDELKG